MKGNAASGQSPTMVRFTLSRRDFRRPAEPGFTTRISNPLIRPWCFFFWSYLWNESQWWLACHMTNIGIKFQQPRQKGGKIRATRSLIPPKPPVLILEAARVAQACSGPRALGESPGPAGGLGHRSATASITCWSAASAAIMAAQSPRNAANFRFSSCAGPGSPQQKERRSGE